MDRPSARPSAAGAAGRRRGRECVRGGTRTFTFSNQLACGTNPPERIPLLGSLIRRIRLTSVLGRVVTQHKLKDSLPINSTLRMSVGIHVPRVNPT